MSDTLNDKNVVENQFEGLNTTLAQHPHNNVAKFTKEDVDIIDWMKGCGSVNSAIATTFAGSEDHRGVIDSDDVRFSDLEFDYELARVYVSKDAYADAIWHATANLVRGMHSAVTIERSQTGRPGFKGNIITVVVKLDRRVTYRVWKMINGAFEGWLNEKLKEQGKRLRTSGHRSAFSGLNFTMHGELPELSKDEDKQRDYTFKMITINGCKNGEIIVSDVNRPYQIKTDNMENYLKALPQELMTDPEHWETRIDGKVKENKNGDKYFVWNNNSYSNVHVALSGKLPGLIRKDSMQQLLEITHPLDDSLYGNRVNPGILDENALTGLKLWLDHGGAGQPLKTSTKSLKEIVNNIGNLNSYNPFLTYLNSLPKWDGKPRVDTMFSDSLGVDDTPLSRYLAQIVTIGMIQMNLRPGTKCDVVVDLLGEQGTGKTTILEKLSNSFGSKKGEEKDKYWWRGDHGWYTDAFNGLTSKDDQQLMTGKIYLNDDELRVSKKTDSEDIKKFASETSLTYRRAYDINHATYYRTFIMFRTTNEMKIYISKLGQRKFWPMVVHKDQIKTPVMGSKEYWTPDWVDQLWAEALYRYRKMGSQKVNELIAKSGNDNLYADLRDVEHVNLQKTDDVTITLVGFIYDAIQQQGIQPDDTIRFATKQLIAVLGIHADINDRKLTTKIRAIMENDLNFHHGRVWYHGEKKAGYTSQKGYYDAVMTAAKAYDVLDTGDAIELEDDDTPDDEHNAGLEPAEQQVASLDK